MKSQIEAIEDGTYQGYAEDESEELTIEYLNYNHGKRVVPLRTVIKILKDIELRLDNVRDITSNYDGDSYDLVDNIYQDI